MAEPERQQSDFPRPTPYDIVFASARGPRGAADSDGTGGPDDIDEAGPAQTESPEEPPVDFEGDRFPGLLSEMEARGVAPHDPAGFVMLGGTGHLIRELMLAETGTDAAGEQWQGLPPEAVAELGALLFHAFRFWHEGRRVLELERAAARYLVESAPAPDAWRMGAPAPAGYVQLPRNLFWTPGTDDRPPEPLDGFFWSVNGRLDVLLCAGVRPGRPGFTAVPVGAELDADGVAPWPGMDARPGGRDFGNVLPGGELEGLYAVTNPAEALKLACLCFWHTEREPASLQPVRTGDSDAGRPLRSRIGLRGG